MYRTQRQQLDKDLKTLLDKKPSLKEFSDKIEEPPKESWSGWHIKGNKKGMVNQNPYSPRYEPKSLDEIKAKQFNSRD